MTRPVDYFSDGKQWLEAALEKRLPEPIRERWQPLRVGVVSLWEYDAAEFWYADGRMVLRGQNGAGKTKVLELTTLMLLRGETRPADLDPFGSQYRSMRFNLLPTGEGDDPRPPSDSGLGYAWIEYGRIDSQGRPRFFVCGMGMSARRATGTSKVQTWHFTTSLRPGKDFHLTKGGRALEYKDLKQIDGIDLPGDAAAYRARLARDLFDLPKSSYDNLTTLLKTLRKPKLGEALSPAVLEGMLRDALPPIDDQEIESLASGWDNLDRLRGAVQYTQNAAVAVANFVQSAWKPWARTMVRHRADEFVKATTRLDNTTRDRNDAQKTLSDATAAVNASETQLLNAKRLLGDRTTESKELAESPAYQEAAAAATRISALQLQVEGLDKQVRKEQNRAAQAAESRRAATEWQEKKSAEVKGAEQKVAAAIEQVRRAADTAGLTEWVEGHLSPPNPDTLRAEYQLRSERFGRLRGLHGEHAKAAETADRSGERAEEAKRAADAAEEQKNLAAVSVMGRAESMRQEIRTWSTSAQVGKCPDEIVEDWCDQVSDLTSFDEDTDDVVAADSVVALMRSHIAQVRISLGAELSELREHRVPLVSQHEVINDQLQRALSQTEVIPPTPISWSRRERPDISEGLGGPLWRLVNPAPGLGEETLALLEAAAAAAGLLDAWVSTDGSLETSDGRALADIQVTDTGSRPPVSLLAVLQPDEQNHVERSVVERILAGVGWRETGSDHDAGDWLSADGSWRIGGLTGRAEPIGPASYLGAAARAAARQRSIERLGAQLEELDNQLSAIDGRIGEVQARTRQLDKEERQLPNAAERALQAEVSRLAERSRVTRLAIKKMGAAASAHQSDLALQDRAWSQFADYAAEHRFATKDLDGQSTALMAYGTRIGDLDGALGVLSLAASALTEADRRATEQELLHAGSQAEVLRLAGDHRSAQLQLSTAQKSLNSDYGDQLKRKENLDADIARLSADIEETNERWGLARSAEGEAKGRLGDYETKRKLAEEHRDTKMLELWELLDQDLVEPLGIPAPEKRTVASARDFATAIKRDIREQDAGTFVEKTARRCLSEVRTLRQEILPDRDVRVEDEDSPLMRVSILIDIERGWLAPIAAADALAARVQEQQERFDAEQQRVLTTLLGSTFIEHLKDRLDYTADTFLRISDQLAARPTRQGHIVRVDWLADKNDPAAEAVVTALRQGYQQLTAERQEIVRDFLRRRIEQARSEAAADGAPHWKEHLAEALDYRRWLRITLSYRAGASGKWGVLDAARHGAKSGGEKVILLAQPLFAAVAVAYNAADPTAPRSVWLDEAMTGVDPTVKASFMGLSVDFDLDIMITAFDEWCNYATVPAIAIYDLARQKNIAGVDCQTFLWCGGERIEVDVERLGAAAPDVTGGLFEFVDE